MDPSENKMYSLAEMDVLLAAAREGDVPKIERLVRSGLDINTRGREENLPNEREGPTMLEEAAAHNQLEMMEFLIQQGANINFPREDNDGSVLLSAAFLGHPDVVKLAIESGADINRRRFMGISALHEAVEQITAENLESKVAIVEILVDCGLNIDFTDDNDHTALHYVAWSGSLHMAEVLVSQGANVNSHVKNGYTPLDRAAGGGSLEVAKFLLQKGAEVNADAAGCLGLGMAAASGDTPMVLLLLNHGAKANTPIRFPELFEAACSGNAETVALLYNRGFARQGPRSVFGATMRELLSVVELLLAQGIDINTRGRDGRSFLHAAVLRQSWRIKVPQWKDIGPPWEVLQFLLDKGADVNIRDNSGQTAQDLAAASGYMDAVEILETKSRCL